MFDVETWKAAVARRRTEAAALLAQQQAEEAIIAEAFQMRSPTLRFRDPPGIQYLGGKHAYCVAPMPTELVPLMGGKLEAWFLALLDGPLAGTRVRLVHFSADSGDMPYGTCYGSIVVPDLGTWYFVDHITDACGARWMRDRHIIPADNFKDSAHPDPIERPGWTCPREERERRWRGGWEVRRLSDIRSTLKTCDRCWHTAELRAGSPCPKCVAYWGSPNDSACGRMY